MPAIPMIKSRYDSAWVDELLKEHAEVGHIHLVALILGSVCYILYTIAFISTIIVQRKRQLKSPTQWSVLFALFLFSSTQFSLQVVEAWSALVKSSDPTNVYGSPNNQFLPAKSMILALSAVTTHVVMLFRLLHYWPTSRLVLVFPVLLVLAGSVGWLGVTIYEIKEVIAQLTYPYIHIINSWSMATYSLIVTCNMVVSTLISSRIYWVSRHAVPTRPTNASLAMNIFVQGGWLYTLGMMIILIAFSVEATEWTTVLYYIVPYLIAAVPTFIIMTRLPPPPPQPTPKLEKPKRKIQDGLSLRCAGLDMDEISLYSDTEGENEVWAAASAVSNTPIAHRPERRFQGYI